MVGCSCCGGDGGCGDGLGLAGLPAWGLVAGLLLMLLVLLVLLVLVESLGSSSGSVFRGEMQIGHSVSALIGRCGTGGVCDVRGGSGGGGGPGVAGVARTVRVTATIGAG